MSYDPTRVKFSEKSFTLTSGSPKSRVVVESCTRQAMEVQQVLPFCGMLIS